jgi:hypothetical protein
MEQSANGGKYFMQLKCCKLITYGTEEGREGHSNDDINTRARGLLNKLVLEHYWQR